MTQGAAMICAIWKLLAGAASGSKWEPSSWPSSLAKRMSSNSCAQHLKRCPSMIMPIDSRTAFCRSVVFALRTTESWGLSDEQTGALLGGLDVAQLNVLRENAAIGTLDLEDDRQQLFRRAVLIESIGDSLHTLFTDDAQANGWIHRPNTGPGFDGRPALALMLNGLDGLDYVCRYLKGSTA